MHFIQALQAEIIQRDRTIHSLQTELTSRSKKHKQTQTAASQVNSTTVIVRRTRKDNSQLRKRMLKLRRKETEEAFKEVANLVEVGENGDGGDIRKVNVSLEYTDGKTNTFWTKEDERVDREREREDHVLWCYV